MIRRYLPRAAAPFTRIVLLALVPVLLIACDTPSGDTGGPSSWDRAKAASIPKTELGSEYGTPIRQPLANSGWEDGIAISRDGLELYCVYVPGDILSFTIAGLDPTEFGPYRRGPDYGMDLVTNPVAASSWLQADILHAHRDSTADSFTAWTRLGLGQPVFSEGAPQLATASDGSGFSAFLYTSNDTTAYDIDIFAINPSGTAPSAAGSPLSGFPRTDAMEDNPHLERMDSTHYVLMFDSDDYAGGLGSNDIFYSLGTDDGGGNLSWTTPAGLSTINGSAQEHQPHLWKDSGGDWYLFYSAAGPDGKLAIWRARMQTADNWDSWGEKTLVVSAGTSAGVGEPTLAQDGDLSFVVIVENPDGSATDRYDADPWFVGRL